MIPLAPIAIGCACIGAMFYAKRKGEAQKPKAKQAQGKAKVAQRNYAVAPSATRAAASSQPVNPAALDPEVEFDLPYDENRIDRWAWDLWKQGFRGDALIIATLRSGYPVTNYGNSIDWPTREPQLRKFQARVRDRVARLGKAWSRSR